jgi:tRNA A-37 threonylcarbamoyl transferase component Bud32
MWHVLNSQVPEPFASLKSVMRLEGELVTHAKNRNVIRLKIEGKTYYVKRYTAAGKGLRAFVGRSRVRAEWENLQYFWHMQIPAPKLLAYGEMRPLFSSYVAGAYVMHAIPNTVPLNAIAEYPELIDHRAWRVRLLGLIARYIKILHDDGFAHGDLYWRNILLALDETPTVYFIDCPQGGHYFGPQLAYQKIRDIACLAKESHHYFSRTDLLRFFLTYRGHERLSPEDKLFIKKVFERHKAK